VNTKLPYQKKKKSLTEKLYAFEDESKTNDNRTINQALTKYVEDLSMDIQI